MSDWQVRILDFFRRVPLPDAGCQFSSRYLSGASLAPADKKIKSHFVVPLAKGIIAPSFYKKNIQDGPALEKSLGTALPQLNSSSHKLIFLLPELSQKVFIIPFENLPSPPEEKAELIKYRLKKQMPLLPRDARLAYEILPTQDRFRVVVAVAKASVVEEYEEILHRLKYKALLAGVPSLSLLNLLDPEKEKNFILVDVEDDSFSLVAVIDSQAFLYRQKPFGIDADSEVEIAAKADDIVQEVANTINFIEHKEQKKVASVWLRMGILQSENGLFRRMEEKLSLPMQSIESSFPQVIEARYKRILSPLIGQIA
jgi:hypothetical protein